MKKVEIFLFDDVCSLDVTGPLEVFTIASRILRERKSIKQGYTVTFSAEKVGYVEVESGLKLKAEKKIRSGSNIDYFIVPGGDGVHDVCENKGLIKKLKRREQDAKNTVSICSGAFVLAEAGLLDGRSCTTHWMRAEQLASQYQNIKVNKDAIFVKDGKFYTSAGISAGIDLALELVQKDYGADVAKNVARIMVVYFRRPGGQSQFSAPMELRNKAGESYTKLHDWILENIESPLLIEHMAEYVAMSARNFSRDFTHKTGITPGKYVELIRFEKARELLESSDQSIELIAKLSGFSREERLRRVFMRTVGVTPTQYRAHY